MIHTLPSSVVVWLHSGLEITLPGVSYEEMKKWWRNDES